MSVFGEAEFWLSGGKVILMFIVFAFTFITMVGGNPQGDAYGFRYWNNPGPFVSQAASTEALGQFEGFLSVLAVAAFIIVGPDYITMIAAEAKHPTIYIKTAFKTVYLRFGIFFIGSALAVGVVLPSNDPKLQQIFINGEGSSTAAGSPYVIAMKNMGITVLPHIVNALLFTSILSAGNTYTYCSVRCLYGLAVQGHAPPFLKRCTKKGIPIYCFLVTMLFPFLSFLSVSNGSANALNILLSVIAGGGLVNYVVISITYLRYYNACKVQGVTRRNLPYYGYFQPYGAWISLVLEFLVAIGYGYSAFTPWSLQGFFANYTMQLLAPILYIFWKVVKRSKLKEGSEVDLVWERPAIDIYEIQAMIDDPPISFWKEIGTITGMNRALRYFFKSSDRS